MNDILELIRSIKSLVTADFSDLYTVYQMPYEEYIKNVFTHADDLPVIKAHIAIQIKNCRFILCAPFVIHDKKVDPKTVLLSFYLPSSYDSSSASQIVYVRPYSNPPHCTIEGTDAILGDFMWHSGTDMTQDMWERFLKALN